MNVTNLNAKTHENLFPRILKNINNKLVLESVIGTTSESNSGFSLSPDGDVIAYLAGCVAILYSLKHNTQISFLCSQGDNKSSSKPLKTLAFSSAGNYLAVSESGHSPLILIWDVSVNKIISRLALHTHEIVSLAWTFNSKYLISVGSEYDKRLAVWNISTQSVVFVVEVKFKINFVAVSPCNTFFVTVGPSHLKYWYFNDSSKFLLIQEEHLTLIENLKYNYVHVAFGNGLHLEDNCYLISSEGHVLIFSKSTKNIKIIVLLNTALQSISFSKKGLAVACVNGTVKILDSSSLDYLYSLPKPNKLRRYCGGNRVNETQTCITEDSNIANNSSLYPDTKVVIWSPTEKYIFSFYNDRSIYIWDVSLPDKIGKYRNFLAHGDSVWCIDLSSKEDILCFPQGTIATSASDGTIRFWDFLSEAKTNCIDNLKLCSDVEEDFFISTSFCNVHSSETLPSISISDESLQSSADEYNFNKSANNYLANKLSFKLRTIKIFAQGPYIAAGDSNGNLHVYSFLNNKFDKIAYIEAHESEILSLEFAKLSESCCILMSASRDRLIHVFTNEKEPNSEEVLSKNKQVLKNDSYYRLINTIDDHTAAVTSLKYFPDQQYLVSAGADKTLMIHQIRKFGYVCKKVFISVVNYSIYDLAVEPVSSQVILVGQEKKIRFYDIYSGKFVRAVDSHSETDLLKIDLDPSGLLMATCARDKIIRLHHVKSGELLTTVHGPSQLITGVKFSNDCKKLISISGDGCIFVWKFSNSIANYMVSHVLENQGIQNPNFINSIFNSADCLPTWIQKKTFHSSVPNFPILKSELKCLIDKVFIFSSGILEEPPYRLELNLNSVDEKSQQEIDKTGSVLTEDEVSLPVNHNQTVYYDINKEPITHEILVNCESQNGKLEESVDSMERVIQTKSSIDTNVEINQNEEEASNTATDFLESNFIPTNSYVRGRKSLSVEFFIKNSVLEPNEKSVKKRNILTSADIEKTRARLEELGIHYGTKKRELLTLQTPTDCEAQNVTNDADNNLMNSIMVMDAKELPDICQNTDELDSSKNMEIFDTELKKDEKYLLPIENADETENLMSTETNNSQNPLFLDTLADAFYKTVEFYYELKQLDEDSLIAHQIASVFSDMHQKIDEIFDTKNKLLDKYSNMLIDLFKEKLQTI